LAQENQEEPISQPVRPSRHRMAPAYNAPDRIAVRSSCSLNTELSFLYWMPMEENLEPGVIIDTTAPTATKGDVIDFDFQYKPGFKVGLGFGFEYDNWDFSALYTRLRSTMKTEPNVAAGRHISPLLLMPQITDDNNYDSLNEKWHLTLDFLDALLSRSYFNGTQLAFCYFFGVRGAWIYQNLINQFGSVGNTVRGISTANGIVDSNLVSDSWAVGPRAGLNGNWKIGKGARIYGNGAADLLFTRYRLSRKESSTLLDFTYDISKKEINCLRAHIDLELGLGWGSHFCDSKWHVDFSAGYTFQAFFDQNMFRTFYTSGSFIGEAPHGNLYIQGLTVTAQFDF
jgi:hypothetical protein